MLKSTFTALALVAAAPAAAAALPDDQGWNGPGWYISGGACRYPNVKPAKTW